MHLFFLEVGRIEDNRGFVWSQTWTCASSLAMNSFANRFSATEAYGEDEDNVVSPAMWGSQGGFGNIAPGAPPIFNMPNVQDVRVTTRLIISMP